MTKTDKELKRRMGFRDDFDWETRFDLKTKIGNFLVSTVDLGIDYNLFGKKPLYYETMIFSDNKKNNHFEYYQIRYSTEKEARKGHKKAVDMVKKYVKGEKENE